MRSTIPLVVAAVAVAAAVAGELVAVAPVLRAEVAPSIHVTGPPAGVTVMVGGFVTVTWQKAGRLPSQVDISLHPPGCEGTGTRLAALTSNDGSEKVHIPPTVADNYYSIRVQAHADHAAGCSERFHVLLRYAVTEPRKGDMWRAGTARVVRWRADRPGGPAVNIALYRPGAMVGSCLVRGTPNDGEQPVTIPAETTPGYYRILMGDEGCGGRGDFETYSGEFYVTAR